MLQAAMPALRSANSKLERRSRCFPTPLVRNIFFATNAMDWLGVPLLACDKFFFFGKLASAYCEVNHYSVWKLLQRCYKTSPGRELRSNVSFHAEADAGSKRFGDDFQLAQLLVGEIRPRIGSRICFARNLNHAYHPPLHHERRAHNL